MSGSAPALNRPLVITTACMAAGALAVPVHAVATPVSAVAAGLAALLGLRLWRWAALPSWGRADGGRGPGRIAPLLAWTGIGFVLGVVLLAVIRLVLEPAMPAFGGRLAAAGALPPWRRILLIYVAAVGEEVVFRLILLSAIAGIAVRFQRLPGGVPTRAILWWANGLSALAFAAAHLPAWTSAVSPSFGLLAAILMLNFSGGIVFGRLFAMRGISAAMLAHAGADGAMLLLGPLTG